MGFGNPTYRSLAEFGGGLSLRGCLQIAEQPVEGCSICGMLLPVAEIANMPRTANIAAHGCGASIHGFIDADWEKERPVFAALAFHGSVHFTFHPSALHRGAGTKRS